MKRFTRSILFAACTFCLMLVVNFAQAQVSINVVKQGKANPTDVQTKTMMDAGKEVPTLKQQKVEVETPKATTVTTTKAKKEELKPTQKTIQYMGKEMTMDAAKALRKQLLQEEKLQRSGDQ
mgnify:CR=1 FL=1